MSSQKFANIMQEEHKQQIIELIIQGFSKYVDNLTAIGKTSYRFDTVGISPQITKEDLMTGIQRRYPGSKISYHEDYVNISLLKKVLKKTILIDWS